MSEANTEPAVPQRRATALRMFQLLKRDVRFEWSFRTKRLIPHGAQQVLLTLLREIARSPELGVWRPAPELAELSPGLLLARTMEYVDADSEVSADLALLLRAGVIEAVEGGGLRVAVDAAQLVRNAPAPQKSKREPEPALRKPPGFKDPGGRPKGGEDPRQRKIRLFGVVEEKAAKAGTKAEGLGRNLSEKAKAKGDDLGSNLIENRAETFGKPRGFRRFRGRFLRRFLARLRTRQPGWRSYSRCSSGCRPPMPPKRRGSCRATSMRVTRLRRCGPCWS